MLASPEPNPAAAALFVWLRRTMARRRADRVLVRVTAAVDRKRTRRQLRCWRDGARRARRAERAVTYSMLVVVGRASHAFHTWRCVARQRSDAQVPRHSLYTTRPRAIHTASPSLWARAASAHLANTTCPTSPTDAGLALLRLAGVLPARLELRAPMAQLRRALPRHAPRPRATPPPPCAALCAEALAAGGVAAAGGTARVR